MVVGFREVHNHWWFLASHYTLCVWMPLHPEGISAVQVTVSYRSGGTHATIHVALSDGFCLSTIRLLQPESSDAQYCVAMCLVLYFIHDIYIG